MSKSIKDKIKELKKENEFLLSGKCCGRKMILESTHEEENNKVCIKYSCFKCKKTIQSLEDKPPKKVILTLTGKQYEFLLNNFGKALQIIHENKECFY